MCFASLVWCSDRRGILESHAGHVWEGKLKSGEAIARAINLNLALSKKKKKEKCHGGKGGAFVGWSVTDYMMRLGAELEA